jgi:hypothetical protein
MLGEALLTNGGRWTTVQDVRAGTQLDRVKALSDPQILGMIVEAEFELEQEFNLDIETSRVPPWVNAKHVPYRWRATFNAWPEEEAKFRSAAKTCTIMILDRIALNPRELSGQSVKGVSAQFGPRVPTGCHGIMYRWAMPAILHRA